MIEEIIIKNQTTTLCEQIRIIWEESTERRNSLLAKISFCTSEEELKELLNKLQAEIFVTSRRIRDLITSNGYSES
jgi:hypothetical protein